MIIAGGITSINNTTDRVDIYDVETGIWTQASLSAPRSFSENGATINGKVYFPGGGSFQGSGFNNPSNVIDVYDAATNSWSVMNLQTARTEHSVNAVGNYLVVAGGKNTSGQLSSVEIYNTGSSSCLPEGITFTTQEQIDNFQANYPGCTEIEGNVTIDDNWSGSITNLNGLSVLTSIGGNLEIGYNNALNNLTGLENLASIWGNINIYDNDALTSLSGLESLTSIAGDICIFGNNALSSLNGLENVAYITGSLCIGAMDPQNTNSALTSLTGLNNLTSIGEDLFLNVNDALTSLTGLEGLTSIGGRLDIQNNFALTSLTGLEGLTSIGGSMVIFSDTALTNLSGLEGLTSIGGVLYVAYNHGLTSLTGLENVDAVSITSLTIIDNNILSTCDVQSICDYLAYPNGTIEIHDNALGCNSPEEVIEACLTSAEEVNWQTGIRIIPNPANEMITLSVEDGSNILRITITNRLGQKVFDGLPAGKRIDISTLSPGLYIISVLTNHGGVKQKVIIE